MNATPPEVDSRWDVVADGFVACHTRPVNLALHLITTPLGLWGFLAALAMLHPVLPATVALGWGVWLVGRVPWGVLGATAVLVAALVALAAASVPWWVPLAAVAGGWVVQELAHHVTGEPSFQSSYQGRRGWLGDLAEHTVLLVPLVLLAAWRGRDGLLGLAVARSFVLKAEVSEPTAQADLAALRDWVVARAPTVEHTTHWWRSDLTGGERAAYDRLAASESIHRAFRAAHGRATAVIPLHGMNEVYVAGPEKDATSDTVFYLSHVDGPFGMLPFATVYRCLVAINPNARVRTHFPMLGEHPLAHHCLTTGEVLAFDYHRQLHRIDNDPAVPAAEHRIVLKLHYAVSPGVIRPWGRFVGWLSTRYNAWARALFLETIAPDTPRERLRARLVLWTTRAFDRAQQHLGLLNLAYVGALALAGLATGSWLPLLVGASFVHYLIYIATHRVRGDVAYRQFVRDVVFYKAVALVQLFGWYAWLFVPDPLSVAMVAGGFGLAAMASLVLGVERTYFGAELGQVPPKWIDAFPYGAVPHPMILGGIVGLLGLHAMAPFREAWPWLVPAHVALYVVHLVQEAAERRVGGPGD